MIQERILIKGDADFSNLANALKNAAQDVGNFAQKANQASGALNKIGRDGDDAGGKLGGLMGTLGKIGGTLSLVKIGFDLAKMAVKAFGDEADEARKKQEKLDEHLGHQAFQRLRGSAIDNVVRQREEAYRKERQAGNIDPDDLSQTIERFLDLDGTADDKEAIVNAVKQAELISMKLGVPISDDLMEAAAALAYQEKAEQLAERRAAARMGKGGKKAGGRGGYTQAAANVIGEVQTFSAGDFGFTGPTVDAKFSSVEANSDEDNLRSWYARGQEPPESVIAGIRARIDAEEAIQEKIREAMMSTKELNEHRRQAFVSEVEAYSGAAQAVVGALDKMGIGHKNARRLEATIEIARETAMAYSAFAVPGMQLQGIAHLAAAVQWGVVLAKAGGGGGGGGSRPPAAGGGFMGGGGTGDRQQTIVVQVGDGFVGDAHKLAEEINERVNNAKKAGRIQQSSTTKFE